MAKAYEINHRRPKNIFIHDSAVSLSGRYMCFYGQHFEKGAICYVFGVSDITNNQITMRHYNDRIPGCIAPKAQCRTDWELFKSKMTEKSEHHGQYETDEQTLELETWFARADKP